MIGGRRLRLGRGALSMKEAARRASIGPSANTGAKIPMPGPLMVATWRLMTIWSSADAGTSGPTAWAQRYTSSSMSIG